jgi:ferredoxin--NADP+ reductase
MKLLLSKLDEPKNSGDLTEVISHNKVVTQKHWEQINAAEVAAGEPLGKPRKKAVSREELLNLGAL